jgi:hypothetical protein
MSGALGHGLGYGTEASAPGVSLDNDGDGVVLQPRAVEAEEVKVESLVDRYALTRTSAEEALSIGARRGFAPVPGQLGPGGTEEFVLPLKSRADAVDVAPYAAAPPSILVSSTPPRPASSFAASPGPDLGRNDPTVRRKPGSRVAWMVAGGLVASAAAFGFYLLGTRHAGSTAVAPVAAPTSAGVAQAAVALPKASALAMPPPAGSAPPPVTASAAPPASVVPPVTAPPPVAVAAPPKVVAPAPAPKPVARTPKPASPPHAVAGPPRVSSGL